MANSLRLIIFLSLVSFLPVIAESSEYELFAPTAQEGEQVLPERGKGVLVRRITIKPGDTLSRISRNFSDKGSYFPQILLFNDIKNPDLIIAGNELLVPVSKKGAVAKTSDNGGKISSPAKRASAVKSRPARVKAAKAAAPADKKQRKSPVDLKQKTRLPVEQLNSKEEQETYAAAISAYRKEEYKKALSLFSRFLELYPSSALAPDASFYKAESLFKLSGQ
ncbi:MAG TPA: LysM peptidoglycan-binding domain-containing protein [Geobacteraceae bacterium]|nr:LysM peptidoglycan-binding domain-containing protein [Geobacteraceae bacterium]